MFINKEEKIELKINGFSRIKFLNKIGFKNNKIGDKIEIPWYYLKSSYFRRYKLKLKCNECGKEFYTRIENLNENIDEHYCPSCRKKGEKNGMFGKSISETTRESIIKWHEENENPSKSKEAREKISKAKKGQPSSMLGKHHSEKSKSKISKSNKISIKEAWELGSMKSNSKYANIKIKDYKGKKYQGSYELDFLKEMEKIGILDLIERGPAIKYIDKKQKERWYLVDYKINGTNILVEIKSSYTKTLDHDNLLIKEEYAKKYGDYIMIIDKDYSFIKDKIKNIL